MKLALRAEKTRISLNACLVDDGVTNAHKKDGSTTGTLRWDEAPKKLTASDGLAPCRISKVIRAGAAATSRLPWRHLAKRTGAL